MLQKTISRLGTAFVIGVALFGTTAAAQVRTQSAAGQLSACTATVSGDSVKVATVPIIIQAAVTAELGDSVSASFPAESKINVVKVSPAADKQVKGVELTINTSEAKPGSWPISLKGKSGECTGQLKITDGK
jgi:FlaG/FlaF family flagellin (archaellin)